MNPNVGTAPLSGGARPISHATGRRTGVSAVALPVAASNTGMVASLLADTGNPSDTFRAEH
jgi:hypothetical protein